MGKLILKFFRDAVFYGDAHQYFLYCIELACVTTFLMRVNANYASKVTTQMIADRDGWTKLKILQEWSARRIDGFNNVEKNIFITCADLKKMWIMHVCRLIQFIKFWFVKKDNRIENLKNGIEIKKLMRMKFTAYKLFLNELQSTSALVYRNMMVQYYDILFPLSDCCKIHFLIFQYLKSYVIRRI